MDETKQAVEVEKPEDRIKLLTKLNDLRKLLMEKGILVKGAVNDFDNYEYFSEAQYKELFTELFSKCGIGFNSTETNVQLIDGTDKQKFGVFVTIEFQMSDIDTGYTIKSIHSGIACDKGDKALYKAKTGALKYFFATTFLVATKDDPERVDDEKPKRTNTSYKQQNITDGQKTTIKKLYEKDVDALKKVLSSLNKKKIDELTLKEVSDIIQNKKGGN